MFWSFYLLYWPCAQDFCFSVCSFIWSILEIRFYFNIVFLIFFIIFLKIIPDECCTFSVYLTCLNLSYFLPCFISLCCILGNFCSVTSQIINSLFGCINLSTKLLTELDFFLVSFHIDYLANLHELLKINRFFSSMLTMYQTLLRKLQVV